MSEFFDYDPTTGMRYDYEWDHEKQKAVIYKSQDLQPVLDYAAAMRNNGVADKGIKKDWWNYCIIPAWLEIELLDKGINIHDKNATKDVIREINQNYPRFKLTDLHHSG